MPTGSGKTFTFSDISKSVVEKGGDALILTDRIELLTQAGGALSRIGLEFGEIKSGGKLDLTYKCHVGMVETFSRRARKYPELLEKYKLVIIDECHKGNFRKVIKSFPDTTYIIGATATPLSTSKADPLKNYFNDIVCPVDIPDLIKDGYLVPARTFSAEFDKSNLVKIGGEYSEESQMQMFDKRERYSGVIEKWREFADGRRTMCFCVNVDHSKKTASAFRQAGIPAEHVDGTTSAQEREHIFNRHKAGEFLVLCNVGITTAGYDDPVVSCIIFDRVTTSLPLWLQCCGRGSRPSEGKSDFIVLDMGENHTALGLWQEQRDWKDIFHNPKKKGEGIAPTKACPKCDSIIRASAKVCEYCLYEFPPPERNEEDLNVAFQEIIPAETILAKPSRSLWPYLSLDDLALYVKRKIYHNGWAARVLFQRENPEALMYEFAQIMEYSPKWVDYQMNKLTEERLRDSA